MTDKWIIDTGLIATLLLMVVGYADRRFLYAAGAVLLVVMIYPRLLSPLAYGWLKVSKLLSFVGSTIILGVIFFCIILPIGLIRRMVGADSLQMRTWRQASSMLRERQHRFVERDLSAPY